MRPGTRRRKSSGRPKWKRSVCWYLQEEEAKRKARESARGITAQSRAEASEILHSAREEAERLAGVKIREAKKEADEERRRLLHDAKAAAEKILQEAQERHEALEAGRSEAAWKQSKEFSMIITSQAKKEADEILNAAREEAGQIIRKATLEAGQHGEKLVDETRKSAVGRSKKFISEAERQAEEILLLAREEWRRKK